MNYFLSIALIFFFDFAGTLQAKDKDSKLTGIWKEVLSNDDQDTPVTFVFFENSDSVLVIDGFGYDSFFYKYTTKGDSLFIHNCVWGAPKCKDLICIIHKTYLEWTVLKWDQNADRYRVNKLKSARFSKEFDEISIIPTYKGFFEDVPRFNKFTLKRDGKYFFEPNSKLKLVKNSGDFNKMVFPYILASLQNLNNVEYQYAVSNLKFTISYYKNGNLIKEVKNDGSSEMRWIFQFINLYTYRTY